MGDEARQAQDLARVDLMKQPLDTPVEQFTIAVDKTGDGGLLKLMWENTAYSAPIVVKK